MAERDSSTLRAKVIKNHQWIVRNIDLRPAVDRMISEFIIHHDEQAEILAQQNIQAANRKILQLLYKRSHNAFEYLIEELNDTESINRKDAAEKILKTEIRSSVNEDTFTGKYMEPPFEDENQSLIGKMAKDIEELKQQLEKLKGENSRFSNEIKELKGIGTGPHKSVSFTATISGGIFQEKKTIIKFPDIKCEHNANYNADEGIFTCTVAGTYLFFTNLVTYGATCVGGNICKNNDTFTAIFANKTDGEGTGSTMCILDLNCGDRVYVKCQDYSGYLSPWSSFSGVLITPK